MMPLRRLWYWTLERLAGREVVEDIRRLLGLVRKPRWTTPALFALGLLSSIAEAVGITLILLFFYIALGQQDPAMGGVGLHYVMRLADWFGDNRVLAAAILAMIVARALIAWRYNTTSAWIGEEISRRARDLVHRNYLAIDYGRFQSHDIAQLMETLGSETWAIARAYRSWTRLLINGCSIAVFTLLLLALSWRITLVALAGSLAINLTARLLARRARAIGAETRAIHRDMGEQMLMTLQGMRTIRAFGQEEHHRARFEAASARASAASLRQERMTAWLSPMTELGYLAILCLIVAGIEWWGAGFAITLASVVMLYRLQPHVRELETNLLVLAQLQPQLRSVRTMMEAAVLRDDAATLPAPRLSKGIAFKGVDFAYPNADTPTVSGLDFLIPAGCTTALVGPSGAGKTTIVNLLLRLYQPAAGTILIDGVPLADIDRADWLSRLAIAGQDVELVEGTVIDNIRMADPAASEEAVIAAARDAGVSDFIEGTPWGYETWIGQEAMRFSGGQRQRIGLARALLRDPDLLILDEATSALDRELEDRIRLQVARRMAGRTTLLITHRPDLIREADHVVWLDRGTVRGEGKAAAVLDQLLTG
ncbi:ABC transporter ATP-binding protein [Sphingomonas sp.]